MTDYMWLVLIFVWGVREYRWYVKYSWQGYYAGYLAAKSPTETVGRAVKYADEHGWPKSD